MLETTGLTCVQKTSWGLGGTRDSRGRACWAVPLSNLARPDCLMAAVITSTIANGPALALWSKFYQNKICWISSLFEIIMFILRIRALCFFFFFSNMHFFYVLQDVKIQVSQHFHTSLFKCRDSRKDDSTVTNCTGIFGISVAKSYYI